MASLTRVAPELPVRDMAEALQHYEKKLVDPSGNAIKFTEPLDGHA